MVFFGIKDEISANGCAVWVRESADADALIADADGFLPKRLYTAARDTEGKETNDKAEEKNPAAEGIYTLTGVRLPDGVTPKAGVYIKDGKKVVIK